MKIIWLSLLVTLVGCSSSPKLYPNEKYKSVSKDQAEKDIDYCKEAGDKYLDSSEGKKIAKSAGGGAMVGAAFGVATGLFTGDFGGAIARGGVTGAAVGGTVGALSPDEIKRRFVNRCLGEKGYEVIGWD